MQSAHSTHENVISYEARRDRVEALISRCAAHDEEALEELYRLVSGQLYGVLVRILREPALAEEALQEVMVQVWQRAKQYDAYRGRAMTWLVNIARYRAIDLVRQKRDFEPLESAPLEAITDVEDFTEVTTSQRSQRALASCLEQLSADQQRCIVMAYADGHTHEEIAGKVERPVPTVRSWIRRGLLSLKRCMES